MSYPLYTVKIENPHALESQSFQIAGFQGLTPRRRLCNPRRMASRVSWCWRGAQGLLLQVSRGRG